jgi:hypothetical protein
MQNKGTNTRKTSFNLPNENLETVVKDLENDIKIKYEYKNGTSNIKQDL